MTTQLGRTVTVNLLTGFLGAGKTSLLKRLLAEPDLRGTAVMINEFGEVGLDHLLIEEVDEEVVLLQSGCVCCTIRGDLKDAMLRLHERARKGEIPAFDRLAIETTGLADPAPIVATLSADPVLRNHYRLGNVVTVVDAVSGNANLQRFEESRKQVAVADRIVLSKTDLQENVELEPAVRSLNPLASILHADEQTLVSQNLFTHDIHNEQARQDEAQRWVNSAHNHPHDHEHGQHVSSFVLEAEAPIDWAAFGLWLSMLLNRHGQKILRAKGLLHIKDIDRPVVIHGVQHTIHKPVHLDHWPGGVARTRLVMIVEGLDANRVRQSFDQLVLNQG